jgi:hypothetical protein
MLDKAPQCPQCTQHVPTEIQVPSPPVPEADKINNDEANPLIVSPSISALGIESDLLGLGEPQEETELPRTKKKGLRKPIPDADGWDLSPCKNGYRSENEQKESISGAKTFTPWYRGKTTQ